MIWVTDFGYDVYLHLNKEETGMVLEYAIDLMEGRDANNQAGESTIRATEILPEGIQTDVDDRDYIHMNPTFKGDEWLLIARMTWLMRESGILPDLRTMAYVNQDDGERGVRLLTPNQTVDIPLPSDCGSLHILEELLYHADLLCR